MQCSTCGYPLEEDDRFCGHCRAPVRTDASTDEPKSIEVQEEKPVAVQASSPSVPDTAELVLETNVNRVLLEGAVLPLEFRIHSEKNYSQVVLAIRAVQGIRAERRLKQLHAMQEIVLDVAIPKGCSGIVGFEISLTYQSKGKTVELHGTCRHEICPAAGDGNITIDIQQGHAGDIHVSGLKELAAMSDKRTLIRELSNIEPHWKVLPLQKVAEKKNPTNQNHRSAILKKGSKTIHLFTGTALSFGRKRDNDILTRLNDLSASLLNPSNPHNPNRFISSYHGWLHRTDEGVFVVDGSMVGNKPSTSGTFLDGKRIVREKLSTQSTVLSLAGKDASLPTIYSLHLTLLPEGLILSPSTSPSTVFIWLFNAVTFEGSSFEHRADGFYYDGKKIENE